MKETNQHELIDLYVSGRMTENESVAFEEEMDANPILKEEVMLQKNIVSGIRHYRKAELKARLSSVNVEPSVWQSTLGSAGAKVVYGVVATATIGLAIYTLTDTDDQINTKTESEIVMEEPIPTDHPQPEYTIEIVVPELEESKVLTREKIITQPAKESIAPESKSQITQSLIAAEGQDKTKTIFTPDITLPTEDLNHSDEPISTDDVDDPVVINPNVGNTNMIDVEVFESDNGLNYKYFQGKLSLFGDFSLSPYEVLEVNSKGGKEIYLYYDDAYYKIILTRVTIPLQEVTDRSKIQELRILRGNK